MHVWRVMWRKKNHVLFSWKRTESCPRRKARCVDESGSMLPRASGLGTQLTMSAKPRKSGPDSCQLPPTSPNSVKGYTNTNKPTLFSLCRTLCDRTILGFLTGIACIDFKPPSPTRSGRQASVQNASGLDASRILTHHVVITTRR